MGPDGSYRPVSRRQDEAGRDAQLALIQHWRATQGKAGPPRTPWPGRATVKPKVEAWPN